MVEGGGAGMTAQSRGSNADSGWHGEAHRLRGAGTAVTLTVQENPRSPPGRQGLSSSPFPDEEVEPREGGEVKLRAQGDTTSK